MKKPIYFDYMSTTPVDSRVIAKMQQCLGVDSAYGNPSSATHYYGFEAKEWVDQARQQVARTLNCQADEIIWTSGATEANNLAIQGVAQFYRRQGNHLIVMQTEHKAVLDVFKFLETQGFEVTFLKPLPNGLLDLETLKAAIKPKTLLISVMHVNNETGVIQDIQTIGEIAKQHGIKFHIDAAQSVGKAALDLQHLPVDLASFSAHKAYGPKGVGALFVRKQPRTRLQPLFYGGGHEQKIRPGTIATHQVVGMGAAFDLVRQLFNDESQRIKILSEKLWHGLKSLGGIYQNADTPSKIPHCLNLRFEGVDGEALLVSLREMAVSTGSACNSANPEPSHVLSALGLTRVQAQNSLRISLGRYTSEADIDVALQAITREVTRLRAISPVWERIKSQHDAQ